MNKRTPEFAFRGRGHGEVNVGRMQKTLSTCQCLCTPHTLILLSPRVDFILEKQKAFLMVKCVTASPKVLAILFNTHCHPKSMGCKQRKATNNLI